MPKGFKSGGRKRGTPNKNSQQGVAHLIDHHGRDSMVYLMKASDRYKIGFTTNMGWRFRKVVGLCPYPLELIWILKTQDFRDIEKGLHNIFKSKRVHYEWFLLSQNDVDQILKIKEKADLSKIFIG